MLIRITAPIAPALGLAMVCPVQEAPASSRDSGDSEPVFMQVGSRLRLAYPPDRDFSHPEVPLGSTLVYDLELLQILQGEEK